MPASRRTVLSAALAAAAIPSSRVLAQSLDVIRIGVLTDLSGNYRDVTAYYSGERSGLYPAAKGWDFVTGLGAPLVNSLLYGYLLHQ